MLSLEEILKQAKSAIETATDLKSLEDCRVHYLGKKAKLTEYLKTLGQLSPEERPIIGQKVNEIKQVIQQLIETRSEILKQKQIDIQLAEESIDITLPGRLFNSGSLHPITHTCHALRDIFTQMGFIFMEGPEIEDDYHNFTALNVPPLHPARAMQDTFYFPNGTLLRSQTSTVQIRAMKTMTLPLRMIAMGRVYRRDFDLTHTPMFHQLECLMIDENVSFADLKGLLIQFLHAFFSPETAVRFRPSYFPFTEPSAEVDITCLNCKGNGCRICKQSGWLEILGCGMVHPNVLLGANIDTKRYRGFAFGVGIDRLTLLKYGIADLRTLFENDLRFLRQF
ncbi:MAG: phenylalanine--tRNA ligase subunit alpha [Gammaproteobacteria bacterium RIFCSPHIGHO2_12_FULL_37_14]|nr:MAG: phenylalanine--tRNA ligase subunit alpha [Gammaproteobacteria bacterium RIFCSPHIGHO2_12_FULL_37_14]